jgi:two-component system response regulator HydG
MDHFRKQFIKRHNRGPCNFTPSVTRKFLAYAWPGNIRQLRNFVETMVVLDTDGKLDLDDLPPELYDESALAMAQNPSQANRGSMDSNPSGKKPNEGESNNPAVAGPQASGPAASSPNANAWATSPGAPNRASTHYGTSHSPQLSDLPPSELIGKTMDQIERWAIEETLKMTAGNREEAAKLLEIGARTLYRKLDKYKHESDESPGGEVPQ